MIVKEKLDFSRISDCAGYLSKAAYVAYWTDGNSVRLAHHEGVIIAEFNKLAATLGYRVEKIEQPVEASEAAE